MARIRSIKPEFVQSETIGNLSRDARLLFIQLWTIADDEGRGRGAYPLLAGALYPYDQDALALLPQWMEELIEAGCVLRYERDRATYFQVAKWSVHQKIDKPTPSRFPPPNGDVVPRQTERDVETELYNCLKGADSFLGKRIVDVQRQVRVGSSYLDIVLKAADTTFVFEVKRDRVTGSDVGQVMRYCALIGGVPILVGPGMSPRLSVSECEQHDIAVLSFADRSLTALVASSAVTERSITFPSVIESHALDLGPRTRDLGEGIGHSEAIASAAEPAALAPVVYADATDELWRAGPVELDALGVKPERVKGLIGKWRKDAKDDAAVVIAAIRRASALRISDPIPWITQAVQQPAKVAARASPKERLSTASLWAASGTGSNGHSFDEPPYDQSRQLGSRAEPRDLHARGPVIEPDRGDAEWAPPDRRERRAYGH